ncbi:MAG: hypothetical protein AAF922_14935 [Pseudomonadota bacterium]
MTLLIWLGAAVTLCGLALLIWCIVKIFRIRRATQDDKTMRASLQRLVPLNTGALLLSVLGLMLVVAGIFLG